MPFHRSKPIHLSRDPDVGWFFLCVCVKCVCSALWVCEAHDLRALTSIDNVLVCSKPQAPQLIPLIITGLGKQINKYPRRMNRQQHQKKKPFFIIVSHSIPPLLFFALALRIFFGALLLASAPSNQRPRESQTNVMACPTLTPVVFSPESKPERIHF